MSDTTTTPKTTTVGIKEIAAKLKVEPKNLRAFIRANHSDAAVGRGKRYAWPSMTDPEVKKIIAAWTKAQKTTTAEKES